MPIEGVIASVVTPFDADGSVLWDQLQEETARLSRSALDGLCVGGFLSETEGSTPDEMFRLCQTVSRTAKKTVLAMITPDSQPEASEMLRAVESGGAQAVFVAQPHYLSQPDTEGLVAMFRELKEKTRLPLMLANCQKSAMVSAAAMHEMIHAKVVDGILIGGDGAHLIVDLMCLHPDVPVFSGMEDLHYVGLLLGAKGIVSDVAAIFPDEITQMYRAYQGGDHDEARSRHERIVRLWRVFEHPSEKRARLRSALAAQGRKVGRPRSPYDIGSDAVFAEVQDAIAREGLAS